MNVLRRWMSVCPQRQVTVQDVHNLYRSKTPITMVTAYDYPSARACASSPLTDMILVGDSLAQVCLGYPSTTQITLDEMIHHARAVARAVGSSSTTPLLIADMPFGSIHASPDATLSNCLKMIQKGHMSALKLEGGRELSPLIHKLTSHVGIPVVSHVGLLPQRHASFSGYKIQGRDAQSAESILDDALAVQDAGAFAVVVEAVPWELGKYLTERLRIPTIGIGAGPYTSGQVLVYDDIIGSYSGRKPKFVRNFADSRQIHESAIQNFCKAVRSRTFPDEVTESYAADKVEWEKFLQVKSKKANTTA